MFIRINNFEKGYHYGNNRKSNYFAWLYLIVAVGLSSIGFVNFFIQKASGIPAVCTAFFPALAVAGLGIVCGNRSIQWAAAIPGVLFVIIRSLLQVFA